MAEQKDAPATGGKRTDITVVAEDKNWRSYVANELSCAEKWHNDWGFLAGGAIEGKFSAQSNSFNLLLGFHDFVTASFLKYRGKRARSEKPRLKNL